MAAAPTWQDAFDKWNQNYVQWAGAPMNRPWAADADAAGAKKQIDDAYLADLAAYNATNGTSVAPDQARLGTAAQTTGYVPTNHSNDGFFGSAGAFIAPAAMLASAVFAPELLPLVSGANTVAHGGNIGDAAKSAALAYGAGQLGSAVAGDVSAAGTYGTDLGSEQTAMLAAQDAGMPAAGTTLGNIAGKVASTAVQGGNPLTAAVAGMPAAGVNELASQITGFDALPSPVQNAIVSAATKAGSAGVGGLINSPLGAGSRSAVAGGTAPTASALPTLSEAKAADGRYATVGDMGYDSPDSPLAQLYGNVSPLATQVAPALSAGYAAPVQQESLSDMANAANPVYYAGGGLVQHLADGGQPLAQSSGDFTTALKTLGGLGATAQLPKHDLRRAEGPGIQPYAPRVLPQLANLLKARGMAFADGGQPSDSDHPNYDGVPVFRTGGLEGLGGKYVEGKGDGQSDDIPAMLADGEYVFDAQTVADFGNGSNKAGAALLNAMREAIRAHKRSAPTNSIPPKSKTPEQYLMDARKYLKGLK